MRGVAVKIERMVGAVLACAALCACEGPFVESADRQAYGLIRDRQGRALGWLASSRRNR